MSACARAAAVGAAVSVLSCTSSAFVRTDDTFAATSTGRRPDIYLDRPPPVPYKSVGIIEITAPNGTPLSEIVEAAADKGEVLGCEFVVAMAIHKVGSTSGVGDRSAVVLDGPLRRRHDVAPSARETSNHVAQTLVAPTSRQREFVCGVSTGQTPRWPLADKRSARRLADATTNEVWRVAAQSKKASAACVRVRTILQADKDCTGEQCRVPVLLADEFVARCSEVDAVDIREAEGWRATWEKQAPGKPASTSPCMTALRQLATSPQAAETYRTACIRERQPSQIEEVMLEAATTQ